MDTTLYIAKTDCLNDDSLFERLYVLMPEERRKRIDALRFREDKNCSLGAGALLLHALIESGRQINIAPCELKIARTENGKPYLPDFPDFCFSISHTKGVVLCLVSDNLCGADAERIGREPNGVAARFFAKSENRFLENCSETDRNTAFFRMWTMKESYVKAVGKGLSMGLNGFSVVRGDKFVRTVGGSFRYVVSDFEGCAVSACVSKSAGGFSEKIVDFPTLPAIF